MVPPVGVGRHLLVICIILAVGLGGWWFMSGRKNEPPPAPAAPPPPVVALDKADTFFPDLMREAVDGSVFDRDSQPVAYLRALHELKQFQPEDFAKRPGVEFDYAAALTDPASYRGKIVRRRGILSVTYADKIFNPDVAGIEDVYRGVLTDTDGTDGILFDMPEPFSGAAPRKDIVDIEGVFYKTTNYENKKGKGQLIPYFLCRSVKVVDPSTLKRSFDSTPNAFGLAIIAMALMWFLYRIFTLKSRPVVTGIRLRDRAALARMQPMSPMPPRDSSKDSSPPPGTPPGGPN